LSVVAHASIITVAAITSGHTASLYSTPSLVPSEHLLYVNAKAITHNASALRPSHLAKAAAKIAKFLVPDLTNLRVAADASLATVAKVAEVPLDVDIGAPTTDPRDFGAINTEELLKSGTTWALSHPGPEGAYTADVVERVAWPQQDNPHPRYPDVMQRQGVEATFVVQFVVDSTGRVDAKTLDFPKATHPAFLRAVRDALLRSRYLPAELAGIRVRQLVQQQFTFVIAR
jgi:protein TonB